MDRRKASCKKTQFQNQQMSGIKDSKEQRKRY